MTPTISQGDQVAQLAAHEARAGASRAARRRSGARCASPRASPARRRAEPRGRAIPTVVAAFWIAAEGDLRRVRARSARAASASMRVTRLSCARGRTGRVADHEERQRQDREERQERVVGHRAGPAAAVDPRCSAPGCGRRGRAAGPRSRAVDDAVARSFGLRHEQSARRAASGKSRVGCQPARVVVHVEVELADRRSAHSKSASSSKARSSRSSARRWATVTCGW